MYDSKRFGLRTSQKAICLVKEIYSCRFALLTTVTYWGYSQCCPHKNSLRSAWNLWYFLKQKEGMGSEEVPFIMNDRYWDYNSRYWSSEHETPHSLCYDLARPWADRRTSTTRSWWPWTLVSLLFFTEYWEKDVEPYGSPVTYIWRNKTNFSTKTLCGLISMFYILFILKLFQLPEVSQALLQVLGKLGC